MRHYSNTIKLLSPPGQPKEEPIKLPRPVRKAFAANTWHTELSKPRTSLQLCLVAIAAGVCSSALIIAFRLGYESLQLLWLSDVDNFQTLAPEKRLLLPVLGALLIIAFAWITGFKHYRMGIPFVIHRVKKFYGVIPFRTTLNQFFGGMVALASGFSVGREGPSVHLGAAGSSFFGQWLKLPYNSIRILTGCGIAAGISASFNTPFAAVLFVMEVVLREYKIHIFIPVMLAAACGSVMTRQVFGTTHELDFLTIADFDAWLYLYFILFGAVMGAFATFFNSQLMAIVKWFRPMNMARRLLLAGLITGAVGFFVPEAMGSGMGAIQWVVSTPSEFGLLLTILVAKLVLTMFAIGLGVPGGIIGPVLGLGVLCGALMLYPLAYVTDTSHLTTSFALLGIAGFLTAVLHAPLAALSAIMELSYSTEVILPAMLVIVPAYVTSTQFFGNRSIFMRQLDYQKLEYTTSSIRETLQKVGVLAVCDRQYKVFVDAGDHHIMAFLDKAPTHPVVLKSDYEIDSQYHWVHYDVSMDPYAEKPLVKDPMQGVQSQATLAEVYEILQNKRSGAVYVYGNTPNAIIGVITWDLVRSYLYKKE